MKKESNVLVSPKWVSVYSGDGVMAMTKKAAQIKFGKETFGLLKIEKVLTAL